MQLAVQFQSAAKAALSLYLNAWVTWGANCVSERGQGCAEPLPTPLHRLVKQKKFGHVSSHENDLPDSMCV